jgi:hypothetical protein
MRGGAGVWVVGCVCVGACGLGEVGCVCVCGLGEVGCVCVCVCCVGGVRVCVRTLISLPSPTGVITIFGCRLLALDPEPNSERVLPPAVVLLAKLERVLADAAKLPPPVSRAT